MRKLKFRLGHKSLETSYTAFIKHILAYGYVVWDNCTQYEKDELEMIQHEAARIATGAIRLVSLNSLHDELKWESLHKRRNDHKLSLFFKMKNNLTPQCVSSLLPQTVGNASRYSFRNSDNLQTIFSRTAMYSNSFLPSSIRTLKNRPTEARQFAPVDTSEQFLNNERERVPKYFYSGSRSSQIFHTHLPTNCSNLNNDHYNKNMTDSPLCLCRNLENAFHYLLICPL